MHKLLLTALLFIFCANISVRAESQSLGLEIKPHLGKKLNDFTSIIVSPDGSGLPKGSGSVAEGAEIYIIKCAACHGLDGKQKGNQLVGGIGSLASAQPLKTVGSYWPYATTLYDYIARAMPYNLAKSLTADEVYAVSAYILNLNGILSEDAELNEITLPKVKMPNQYGFIEL